MSTSKWLERICAGAVAVCIALTLALFCAKAAGVEPLKTAIGYENRLFDNTKVHTIDIVMDDWDGFLQNCENEEYVSCAVVIDGESSRNVGIRAKGNTSLSNVASMGSSRYSFKIEFDHYDGGKSYHGLDKLCLNNLIQDNTCMKDYLTYQMMNAFGVDSPLCSYAYLTVNGEDWGLYLAVEGVEDAFLQRTENGSGALYKPDSMDMGGGRGNGRVFDFENFTSEDSGTSPEQSGNTSAPALPDGANGQPEQMPQSDADMGEPPSLGENGAMPQFENGGDRGGPPAFGGANGTPPSFGKNGEMPQFQFGGADGAAPSFGGNGGMPQFGGMGGKSDVKLQYIDDDPDSYANIFDNAKTDISDADKSRLIASLASLSSFENLENVLDTEEVLRYFVVHNYVVNGDSYTGSMIHNYYLHECDGRLSMIPWDYNLAFGTFQGGSASSAVNSAIDDVLSDRPMQAWIFSDEAYTERYHALFAEFLDTVDIDALIDGAYNLIAPYVEKDPTKFCTYEEFETGAVALKDFCTLRSESVRGQLAGTVPATSEAQQADSSALISADTLNLADLGTMGSGQGGFGGGPDGFGGRPGSLEDVPNGFGNRQGGFGGEPDDADSMPDQEPDSTQSPFASSEGGTDGAFSAPASDTDGEGQAFLSDLGRGQRMPDMAEPASETGSRSLILLGVSLLVLTGGLAFAFAFKR